MKPRYLSDAIRSDLDEKVILLSGPRQCGKTTLARALWKADAEYLNYDSVKDRRIILRQTWDRASEIVIFDELHKMKKWKSWIKGIADTEGLRPRILVTGSARLDVAKRGGDSLAGRHFSYRLFPFSVAELSRELQPSEAQRNILKFSPFPEPLFKAKAEFHAKWQASYVDAILRQDLIDLERIRDLRKMELLVDLLAERVGSTISYASLSRDLEVSPITVKSWIEILERMFVVFIVTPYSKHISNAIRKEPKVYFFDMTRVENEAARFENLVAFCLLKRNTFLKDTAGKKMNLHFVRNKLKQEVDFLTTDGASVEWLIECKLANEAVDAHFYNFKKHLNPKHAIQLVSKSVRKGQDREILMRSSAEWLAELEA